MAPRKNKTVVGTYVVTWDLHPEKWQEDLLNKRLAMMEKMYNTCNKQLKQIYHNMINTKAYKSLTTRRDRLKYISEFTISLGVVNPKTKQITDTKLWSEYGFITFVSKKCNIIQHIKNEPIFEKPLNKQLRACVGRRLWSAWKRFLEKNGKNTHDTIFNSMSIGGGEDPDKKTKLEVDGHIIRRTLYFNEIDTLRMKDEHLIGLKFLMPTQMVNQRKSKYNPKDGCNKYHLKLPYTYTYIPFSYNTKHPYDCYVWEDVKLWRTITIKRELIKGRYKWYLQITLDGHAYNKGRKLSNDTVGVDLGVSTIACYSHKHGVLLSELAAGIDVEWNEITKLQRKLDRSRRATNPSNYNEDGTIKVIRDENGRKQKLAWVYSNEYNKTLQQLHEKQRKYAAKRKHCHEKMANELCKMGNMFIVEKMNMSGLARRTKEDTLNAKGKHKSKKRFGKSIANHAPSAFLCILKNKVEALGGKVIEVSCQYAASQFDFTSGDFKKHELNERMITLSDGKQHQRDLMAAFNLCHLNNPVGIKEKYDKDTDNEKDVYKTPKSYKVEEMIENYPKFCKYEAKEIKRIQSADMKHIPSAFGIRKTKQTTK